MRQSKFPLRLIGKRIRLLRQGRDWTQTRLAKSIGRSVGLVSKIETGLHPLDYLTLLSVANALGTDVTDLIKDQV